MKKIRDAKSCGQGCPARKQQSRTPGLKSRPVFLHQRTLLLRDKDRDSVDISKERLEDGGGESAARLRTLPQRSYKHTYVDVHMEAHTTWARPAPVTRDVSQALGFRFCSNSKILAMATF